MSSRNMHNDGDNFSIIMNNSSVKVEMQMLYFVTLILRPILTVMTIASIAISRREGEGNNGERRGRVVKAPV